MANLAYGEKHSTRSRNHLHTIVGDATFNFICSRITMDRFNLTSSWMLCCLIVTWIVIQPTKAHMRLIGV